MKTLLKKILILTLMFGTATSVAFENFTETPNFIIKNKGRYISISDASGKIIYSGFYIYNENHEDLFDFSKLKDGSYNVEIDHDFKIEINSIVVKNQKFTIIEGTNKTIFKPVIRFENAKILISKIAFDAKHVSVEIFFNNELIHSNTLKDETIINRVYKLDKSQKGKYTVKVTANEREFIEIFEL